MKRCTYCLFVLPEESFRLVGKYRRSKCWACEKTVQNATRKPQRATKRASRYPADPIKLRARQAVRDAVRHGRIVKPERCERCWRFCSTEQLGGHHFKGYEHALSVEWLCQQCHAWADKEVTA